MSLSDINVDLENGHWMAILDATNRRREDNGNLEYLQPPPTLHVAVVPFGGSRPRTRGRDLDFSAPRPIACTAPPTAPSNRLDVSSFGPLCSWRKASVGIVLGWAERIPVSYHLCGCNLRLFMVRSGGTVPRMSGLSALAGRMVPAFHCLP